MNTTTAIIKNRLCCQFFVSLFLNFRVNKQLLLFLTFLFFVSLSTYGQQFTPCANNNDDPPPYTVANSYDPTYITPGTPDSPVLEIAVASITPGGEDFCIGNDPGVDTVDGKGTFLFTGLDITDQGDCPTVVCFSPRQGCGNALGNACVWVEDPNNPGQWLELGEPAADDNRVCVTAPPGTTQFAITMSRPGNGPVSIIDVEVFQAPDFVVGDDKSICEFILPSSVDLTLSEPTGFSGGTWSDSNGVIVDPTSVVINGNNGDQITFTYSFDASGSIYDGCILEDEIVYTIDTEDCCDNPVNPAPDCNAFTITVILDESGSIGSNAQDVRDAANALADALVGTNAQMAVVEFSFSGSIYQVPGFGPNYNTVTQGYADALETFLSTNYNPTNGCTNWEDALQQAITLNNVMTADVVLFLTDGNPTWCNTCGNGDCSVRARFVTAATDESCIIKSAGSHLYALGVGDNINASNLQQISGSIQDFPGTTDGNTPLTADWAIADFDELAECFTDLVQTSCTPNIVLDKTVYSGHDGGVSCPGLETTEAPNTGEVTYCFTVTNNGQQTLTNVVFDDPTLNIDQTDLVGWDNELSPGESKSYFYQTVLADTTVFPLLNEAEVIGQTLTGPVTDKDTAEVTEPSCIPPSLTTEDDSICEGDSIDLSTLVTTNGTAVTYHASLDDANNNDNAFSSNVSPATTSTFYVRSEVAADCFVTDTITISLYPVTDDITETETVCDGGSFTWSIDSDNDGTSEDYTVSSETTETFNVTDANGCPYDLVLTLAYYDVTPDDTVMGEYCEGDEFFTYEDIDYPAGSYDIPRLDDNGCSYKTVLIVTENQLPEVEIEAVDPLCIDAESVQLVGTPEGGTWSGTGVDENGLFNPSEAGVGDATITYSYADNGGGEPQDCDALVLTGVFDGGLSGGTPKGVELYVLHDIADLSIYGLGSANNGGGTDGQEYTFPADAVTEGTYIYVTTNPDEFNTWFGFPATYNGGNATNINGDDAIELFKNGNVIDIFGDVNVDGTGQAWEHLDGWAYRNASAGPDGSTFVLGNWTFSGINVHDGLSSNTEVDPSMPIGTYISEVCSDCSGGEGTGCSNSAEITITVNPLPEVSIEEVTPLCVDADLYQLVGSPEGGTWSGTGVDENGLFDPGVGSSSITYTYQDANGCENSATINIQVSDLPIIVAADPVCDELTDFGTYSVEVTVSEGSVTSDYTTTDQGGNVWLISDIPNGTDATITVTNQFGCDDTIEVIAPECVCIELDYSFTDVTCFGLDDGTITVNSVSEGATVTINGEPYDENALYAPGMYTIMAFYEGNDVADCIISEDIEITEPDAVDFDVTSTDVTAFGLDDGTITITNISVGAIVTIQASQNGPDLSLQQFFAPGEYIVTAILESNQGLSANSGVSLGSQTRNFDPCIKQVLVTINEPEMEVEILYDFTVADLRCKVTDDTYLTSLVTGTAGEIVSYSWSLDTESSGWGIVGSNNDSMVRFKPGEGQAIFTVIAVDEFNNIAEKSTLIRSSCRPGQIIKPGIGIILPIKPRNVIAYPNPVKDQLNIKLDQKITSNVTIEIYNQLGNKLRSKSYDTTRSGKSDFSFDFKGLPNQMYYVKIITDNGIVTKRVMRNK